MSSEEINSTSEKKIVVFAYSRLSSLHPDFRCRICSEYLTRTHTVPECLHRVCGDCVEDKEKSVMQYQNECSSCRYHIPIKQFLRRDEVFDKMVSCMFPFRHLQQSCSSISSFVLSRRLIFRVSWNINDRFVLFLGYRRHWKLLLGHL